ncbi:MAG: DNA-binding protein [Pseudomonadota bacterium]
MSGTARPIEIQPRLMRAARAAAYLGVSQATLFELSLPKKTHKGMVFYDRLDLDAWVDDLPYQGQVGDKCPDDVF